MNYNRRVLPRIRAYLSGGRKEWKIDDKIRDSAIRGRACENAPTRVPPESGDARERAMIADLWCIVLFKLLGYMLRDGPSRDNAPVPDWP